MSRRVICLLSLTLLVVPANRACAAELAVGPNEPFARIEDALARAKSGDTIIVHPLPNGAAYDKVAVYVTKSRITFKAASPYVALSGKGFTYSGAGKVPRAICQFNPGADGCVLEGFDLSGASNKSHNGAGVRINQANSVTIRNCRIHGNNMGIMSNGDGTQKTGKDQLIESCLIHSNGDRAHPGYNHNLYLGGTSVTLRGCEVHSSLTGHNIKSRAHLTVVTGCYIHDSANREFDLVDARGDTTVPDSNALLAGNLIVKAANMKGNKTVIHFGQDGGNEHDGTIFLVNNTIVTPYISPVIALDAAKSRAYFLNNIIWDASSRQRGQQLVDRGKAGKTAVTGANNWLASGFATNAREVVLPGTIFGKPGERPPFVNPDKGDFRLAPPAASFRAKGERPAATMLEPLAGKLYEFKPPLGFRGRTVKDKMDLGGFECVP